MLKNRFRKYLPVVVDIETGRFDTELNAILEIAITLIEENWRTYFYYNPFYQVVSNFRKSFFENQFPFISFGGFSSFSAVME